jgi:putative RNA 2'-phosphotransferase
MTDRSRTKLSKVMSLILRHEAAKFGLAPDAHGWIDVTPFLNAIREGFPEFREITTDDLFDVVDDPDNPRHEIRDNRIRAVYGHSSHVTVDYPEVSPPAALYHGTSAGGLEAILAEGPRLRAPFQGHGPRPTGRAAQRQECDDPDRRRRGRQRRWHRLP